MHISAGQKKCNDHWRGSKSFRPSISRYFKPLGYTVPIIYLKTDAHHKLFFKLEKDLDFIKYLKSRSVNNKEYCSIVIQNLIHHSLQSFDTYLADTEWKKRLVSSYHLYSGMGIDKRAWGIHRLRSRGRLGLGEGRVQGGESPSPRDQNWFWA